MEAPCAMYAIEMLHYLLRITGGELSAFRRQRRSHLSRAA